MTDTELWERFCAPSLSHQEWTHRAHVRIGYLHLTRYPFDDALAKMRDAIKVLNASHGVVETDSRGYNETITVAFLTILASLILNFPVAPDDAAYASEEFCDQNPQVMTPRVLRLYYSRERLWASGAKHAFTEPDLCRLPTIAKR